VLDEKEVLVGVFDGSSKQVCGGQRCCFWSCVALA
jgi:hypothetical protein